MIIGSGTALAIVKAETALVYLDTVLSVQKFFYKMTKCLLLCANNFIVKFDFCYPLASKFP